MKRKLLAVSVLAALIGFTCPVDSPAADTASIYDTLALMKDHTVLYVAIAEAKEVSTLKGPGSYTLFAPTDAAFKKLDDETIKKVATDRETVRKMLLAHVMTGKLNASDLRKLNGKEHRTLQGGAHRIVAEKDGLRIGGAKVSSTDVLCNNGVIHVIDVVLPIAKE